MLIKSLKFKFVLAGIVLILLTAILLLSVIYYNFKNYAISENVDKARIASNELAAMHSYMDSISSNIKISDDKENRWAVTPSHFSTEVAKRAGESSGFYIKQTSIKNRNLLNAPNANEVEILSELESNGKSEFWKIDKHNGKKSLLYGQSIMITKGCLRCHGKRGKDVPEKLYNKLIEDYGERAFNFQEGDFRGMVSVAVPLEFVSDFLNSTIIIVGITVFILIIIIAYILFILSGNIIDPIVMISEKFKKFSNGKTDLIEEIPLNVNDDEVGWLVSDFNVFIKRINMIIDDVKNISFKLAEILDKQSDLTSQGTEDIVSRVEKDES